MIDLKITEIGGAEIAAALKRAPKVIQARLLAAMQEAGSEAVDRARSLAPYGAKRKTGVHLRDAIRFGAFANEQGAQLLIRAVGGARGAPHAHLIERGVPMKKIRVYRKVYASKLQWLKDANRWRFKRPNRVKNRNTFMYTRRHHITANPFFEPAINSLGDVGAKLQQAVTAAAADVQSDSLLANWDK